MIYESHPLRVERSEGVRYSPNIIKVTQQLHKLTYNEIICQQFNNVDVLRNNKPVF